jgi:meso-butanediol dehydrogenase/(S,S)-butanediol dehydrogenase/diacetyl reductase
MSGRLAGKAALITGAAGGIGAATARLFAREGANVALVDTDGAGAAAVAREIGKTAIAQAADIADEQSSARAVAEAAGAFGKLDILVNNAAVRAFEPVADAPAAAWRKALDVNLLGTINVTKAALPHLRRAAGASIVILSSCYALTGRAGWGQYDASKAALIALTRTLAHEEAPHGIRVNAVCPGGTLTPFTLNRAKARGLTEEQVRATGGAPSLLRRWATPEEMAYPILWLASDEAAFITGIALPVDGGLTAM